MTSESETPGAAGTATEGEFETGQVPPIEYRIRKEWANAAWFALDHCDRQAFLMRVDGEGRFLRRGTA